MELFTDASWVLWLAAISVLGGAIAQSVTGMGFSLVAAPGLLLLLGPERGVAAVVVLAFLASVLPLSQQWRAVRVRDLLWLLIPTLIALPIVKWLLSGVDAAVVAVLAGLAIIAGVGVLWRGVSWSGLRTKTGAVGSGIASAFLNVIGGVGGPPVGIYAANAGWEPKPTRATLQAFFLVQNIVTAFVVGLFLPQWWMLAALVIGTVVGTAITHRVPAKVARLAVLAVAGMGGVSLVVGNA